ncbi:MAG: hypothetical protein B0D91_11110 [Oceanospirillales bacterium LUC14_002_19_P2]|nr:MAG: hypothetical protein B0D91_11110 [Oceanospirillales bacterium LUC14_002_19_P2]
MIDPIEESSEIAGASREPAVPEDRPEATLYSPLADDNVSETDNQNGSSSHVSEQSPDAEAREPETKSDAMSGWWQRYSPGALVKRLRHWWRGSGDANPSDSRRPAVSTKESKSASVDTLTVPMQYQQLKVLSDSVVTCWNFFGTIYRDYMDCIKQLQKLPNDEGLGVSEKNDIIEHIKQQIEELGPQLNDAASDVSKALEIYKTTEKQVLPALSKEIDDAFDVSGIQFQVRDVERRLEKVQTTIKKMR